MNYIFVCYEENKNWLASECGALDEMTIFGPDKKKEIIKWVRERLQVASDNNYVIDKETDLESELMKEDISITLFHSYQDNWDYTYDIVVQKKAIN